LVLENALKQFTSFVGDGTTAQYKMQAGVLLFFTDADTEDHPFSLTRWDVGEKCSARSKDRL